MNAQSRYTAGSKCQLLPRCVYLIKGSFALLALTGQLVSSDVALGEQSDELKLVASELNQICEAHGPDCQCPSCRAFFDACSPGCPPGTSSQLFPADPSMPYSTPSEDELPFESGQDLTSPTPGPTTLTGPITPLPAGLGSIPAPVSANPGTIGDFLFGGYRYAAMVPLDGASVAIAGGDRVTKVAENTSVIPQDRVFFNYNLFANAAQDVNGETQDVNRFVFGTERTFFDELCSLEFRIPFTGGLDATQRFGEADTLAAEFGNLTLTFKALVVEREKISVSAGLGMIFPTADDAVVLGDGPVGLQVESIFANESFYLQPFIGVNYSSCGPLFFQFFAQTSFDTSGSEFSIVADDNLFTSTGTGSERLHTQDLLFMDFSVGYWIYRSSCPNDLLTGIAPMVELHYTSTMSELQLPSFAPSVFEPNYRSDLLNITGGVIFNLGGSTSLRLAGVAPLRDGDDRFFDSEFSCQLVQTY